MPKPSKNSAPSDKQRDYHGLHAWQCRHHESHSDIIAYVEADQTWQPVLTVHPSRGVDTEAMAAYIVALVNQHHAKQDVLANAANALEAILNEGLTCDTEQEADIVIEQLKKLRTHS